MQSSASEIEFNSPFASWYSVRAAKWAWRKICGVGRFLKRHFWKITGSLAVLITAAWQYENWHGRAELAEQRAAWQAEFGEMKLEDFISESVPDEENFFAAPIFEQWTVAPSDPGPNLSARQIERRKAEAAMPHARFLQMKCPGLPSTEFTEIDKQQTLPGLETLDFTAWAKKDIPSRPARPSGMTDAQWYVAVMPPSEVVDGLKAALARSRSQWLPTSKERMAVSKALDDPFATPIPAVSNLFELSQGLMTRARAAARAGDGPQARELIEITWRFVEATTEGESLVHALVGSALEGMAVEAMAEGIATQCWSAEDLKHLMNRMQLINEERMIRQGLFREAFHTQLWPVEKIRASIKRNFAEDKRSQSGPLRAWSWGPEGWLDANLAQLLKWWSQILSPDLPGDDLVYLDLKMNAGTAALRSERAYTSPNPRQIMAAMAIPALTNIAGSALQNQTRRRQLLLAAAVERFQLAEHRLPKDATELVPNYLTEIPGDPSAPGKPLTYISGEGPERYRLVSKNKDLTLAFPQEALR